MCGLREEKRAKLSQQMKQDTPCKINIVFPPSGWNANFGVFYTTQPLKQYSAYFGGLTSFGLFR
jgi:hypothetical protein